MFFKRSVIIFLMLVLVSSLACAEGKDSTVLRITTHELAYANLYKNLSIPANAKNIVLEYHVKGESINGYASGGAVFLWWNSTKYIANRLDSVGPVSAPGMLRLMTPIRIFVPKETYPMVAGTWYAIKIQMTASDISFFIKKRDEDKWTLLNETPRDVALFLPPDGIIIGVGREGSGSYLRNSYEELRKVGSIYFDEVTLTVDDKVILYESFEKSMDELKKTWDFATDPANKEPVFEIVPEDATILPKG